MVNENFDFGSIRLPLRRDQTRVRLQHNPNAGSLRVNDTVKPNFTDTSLLGTHPPGTVTKIEEGKALVKWRGESHAVEFEVGLLVKAGS